MNDKQSVYDAIKGSSVVFGVTNCKQYLYLYLFVYSNHPTVWEEMDGNLEFVQGKLLAGAPKQTNVERFIFSSLPSVSKGIPHSDLKVRVSNICSDRNKWKIVWHDPH